MISINHTLAEILKTVRRPGDFYATGRQEIYAPGINVDGVGAIALPLLPAQAEELIAVAERAPYGRGPETLVDTEVRRTWQLSPEQIGIDGRHWPQDLGVIVSRCAEGLGVEGTVRAELYKLLVYDQGSFFVGHRDTEKAPGMFATLVIVLPSRHAGGELVIRHQGREVCLDLSSEDPSEVAFAAFYADCWHEVRPVTRGCRLALIYNLIRPDHGRLPHPPSHDAELERITALLERWRRELARPDADMPDKLIYPLEHIYTPAGLEFAALKNADAAAAAVLIEAARRTQCELHLSLLSIEESGSAESLDYRPYRRYRDEDDDEEEYELGEIFERTLSLTNLQAPDDSRPPLAMLPFDEAELCPPDALEDAEPDALQFFEATGNAGASFERSYRRAALVLWPREHRLALIVAAGRGTSLTYLEGLAQRWRQGEPDTPATQALRHEAQALARQIIAAWPAPPSWGSLRDHACRFLECLTTLEDRASILAFVEAVTANGDYGADDNPALAAALALLPLPEAATATRRIVSANGLRHPAGCAALLRRICASASITQDAAAIDALRIAAAALCDALPGQPGSREADPYGRNSATPGLLVDLLEALHALQADALADTMLTRAFAQPSIFGMDAVLVPAALQLAEGAAAVMAWPPVRTLTAACLDHLARRIAEPLEAPTDFARPAVLSCRCEHCTQLAAFLANPTSRSWDFKAAESYRNHVEDSIRRNRCDVDTETLRHTRPYVLRCTKNQASYQRRVVQRQEDLQHHARLLRT